MELSCTAQDPFASASDALQLVVAEHTQAKQKRVNQMSDTLQLVVNVANTQPP